MSDEHELISWVSGRHSLTGQTVLLTTEDSTLSSSTWQGADCHSTGSWHQWLLSPIYANESSFSPHVLCAWHSGRVCARSEGNTEFYLFFKEHLSFYLVGETRFTCLNDL